tara:strand:- start:1265 stop:1744 length:480 start_codon:yes stop_codon:yes gene_type:complete
MPPIRKPAHKRQNKITKDITLRPVATPIVPDPPRGVLKVTRERWVTFWRSDVSSVTSEADLPALHRLFVYYDEWERCMAAARKERLVMGGSTGRTPALHPLYSQALAIEARIGKLEPEFGLTPLARVKLGIQVGEAQRSLADLNADADTEDDPRDFLAE